MGYSSAERRSVEQSITDTLQSLRIQLGGKVTLLEDASLVQNTAAAAREKIVQNTLGVLKSSLERLTTLEKLFERYRTFAPSFLDEFLAPEGIITRKRDIDERVNESAAGIVRLRQRNDDLARENAGLREKIEEYRKTLEDLRVNLARLQTQRTGIEQEIGRLGRERTEQEALLRGRRRADHRDARPRDGNAGENRGRGEGAAARSRSRRSRPAPRSPAWKGRSPAATRSWAPRKRS